MLIYIVTLMSTNSTTAENHVHELGICGMCVIWKGLAALFWLHGKFTEAKRHTWDSIVDSGIGQIHFGSSSSSWQWMLKTVSAVTFSDYWSFSQVFFEHLLWGRHCAGSYEYRRKTRWSWVTPSSCDKGEECALHELQHSHIQKAIYALHVLTSNQTIYSRICRALIFNIPSLLANSVSQSLSTDPHRDTHC